MLKGSELINRKLITRDAGELVGKVRDLVVDQTGARVLGILVEEGWLGSPHVVRWSAILTVGEDNLIIDSKTSLVKATDDPEMKDVFDRGNAFAGVHVTTTEGLDLGKFEAFYLDEKSGKILGYELSGGSGRKKHDRSFLPTPAGFEPGKDVAFVSPEVAGTLQDLGEALKQNQQ